jgi:hypothetical protein
MSVMTIDELDELADAVYGRPPIVGQRLRVTATYRAAGDQGALSEEIDRLAVVHGGAAFMVGPGELQVMITVTVCCDGDAAQTLVAAMMKADPILDDVSDALGSGWSQTAVAAAMRERQVP